MKIDYINIVYDREEFDIGLQQTYGVTISMGTESLDLSVTAWHSYLNSECICFIPFVPSPLCPTWEITGSGSVSNSVGIGQYRILGGEFEIGVTHY